MSIAGDALHWYSSWLTEELAMFKYLQLILPAVFIFSAAAYANSDFTPPIVRELKLITPAFIGQDFSIYLAVDEIGSGLDPQSIQVKFGGTPDAKFAVKKIKSLSANVVEIVISVSDFTPARRDYSISRVTLTDRSGNVMSCSWIQSPECNKQSATVPELKFAVVNKDYPGDFEFPILLQIEQMNEAKIGGNTVFRLTFEDESNISDADLWISSGTDEINPNKAGVIQVNVISQKIVDFVVHISNQAQPGRYKIHSIIFIDAANHRAWWSCTKLLSPIGLMPGCDADWIYNTIQRRPFLGTGFPVFSFDVL